MPSRYLRRNFKPNTYHHIFNRGSFKQKIFRKQNDYEVFIDILKYYLQHPTLSPLSKLSDVKLKKAKKTASPYQLLAYCLMPNHFHLLLLQKEISPNLSDFIKKISVTYAMYFQHQYQHAGSLFQGKFRSVQIYPDEQLLYVSKYIHLNPAKLEGSDPSNYPYSSLKDYLTANNKNWLSPQIIFKTYFNETANPQLQYKNYIFTLENQVKNELLKNLNLE